MAKIQKRLYNKRINDFDAVHLSPVIFSFTYEWQSEKRRQSMRSRKVVSSMVSLLLAASMLTGCSNDNATPDNTSTPLPAPAVTVIPQVSKQTITESIQAVAALDIDAWQAELGLTDQQLNSFSMLYYLAITAEEIRTSKDNRLILDDIYTSLLNDIVFALPGQQRNQGYIAIINRFHKEYTVGIRLQDRLDLSLFCFRNTHFTGQGEEQIAV